MIELIFMQNLGFTRISNVCFYVAQKTSDSCCFDNNFACILSVRLLNCAAVFNAFFKNNFSCSFSNRKTVRQKGNLGKGQNKQRWLREIQSELHPGEVLHFYLFF